jgi:SAM-dependent methyltransferase
VRQFAGDSESAKALVRRSYDRCADAYAARRARTPPPELRALADLLPPDARVLDIGCGAGVPITAALAARFQVTGVDISEEQLARARVLVPSARFLLGDVMTVDFEGESLDAAVAFYSIFHLPRIEQPELLRRIARWLRPGGYLLATLSRFGEAGYTEDDFFGATMYWSQFSLDESRGQMEAAGFEILSVTWAGEGYEGEEPNETHPLVSAKRRAQLRTAERAPRRNRVRT